MSNHSLRSSNVGAVILHCHLADSTIARLFRQKNFKVKESQRVVQDSVIFPKAKLAFLVVKSEVAKTDTLQSDASSSRSGGEDLVQTDENTTCSETFIAKIDKFMKTHRHSYVVLQAPLFTSAEFGLLLHLQTRYLHSSVDFLLAHNPEECVDAMLTLVSVQTPPRRGILHERYCDLMNSLLQPVSPRANADKDCNRLLNVGSHSTCTPVQVWGV